VAGGLIAMTALSGKDRGARAVVDAADTSRPISVTTGQPKASDTLANELRNLLDASKQPAQAESVLARVARREPRAKSSEELYLAATLRANVFFTNGQTQRACEELQKVRGSLAPAQMKMVHDRMTNALSCPQN